MRGKAKQKGGAGYVAGTRFLALGVSEEYRSQINRHLEHLELAQSLLRQWQMFCTESTSSFLHTRQENIQPMLPSLLKYLPSLYLPELRCIINSCIPLKYFLNK
jgi:hypothetical protein